MTAYKLDSCRLSDRPERVCETMFGLVLFWECDTLDGTHGYILTVQNDCEGQVFRDENVAGFLILKDTAIRNVSRDTLNLVAMAFLHGKSAGIRDANSDADRLKPLRSVSSDVR